MRGQAINDGDAVAAVTQIRGDLQQPQRFDPGVVGGKIIDPGIDEQQISFGLHMAIIARTLLPVNPLAFSSYRRYNSAMTLLDKKPVAAIILAAGASTRMGEPKQLLPVGGQPMVRRVTEAVCAAGLAQVVVVIGAHAEAVGQALIGLPVELVHNEKWPEGMTSSLHAGLRALRPEIQAALVVLADQPWLTAALIQALADCYCTTGAPVVAPFHQGQRGQPVLFDRALFAELLAAVDDNSRRELIARHWDHMARVDVQDPATLCDIDTRQDYEKIREL